MPTQTKINRYTELLVNSINALSQTENWQSYLETSARLYKFDFKDQAMIHAQRPNATACADYDLWRRTDIADRQVKRGSKGIALIDVNQKVRYVFDYADTEARSDKRLKLWQIDKGNETAVVDMLKIRYGAEADDLVNAVFQAASQIAADYSNDYVNDLIDYTEGSFLESYDNYNVWAMFSQTLENSIAYSLLSRCGVDPAEYFSRDDFEHLYNFNTVETMAILGSSVSELSERILRDIERTTRIFERTTQNERINENIDRNAPERDTTGVQIGRGHGDVSSDIGSTGNTHPHIREVRTVKSDLPQRTQADTVHDTANQGDIEQPPTGNRQDGEQQIGTVNAGTDEAGSIDREPQSRKPDGVGGVDEQPQTVSGGNNLQGTDSHVENEEPEQPERVQTMLGMATVVKDKDRTKDVHVVAEFNQIPTQNYNMFMLAFPQIEDGTYRSMTFKNKDKKELDVYHATTSAGTVHVEISYFGTERPGHRTFDPSFKFEVDFEKRRLKPISYHNDRTGEDVNVLSIPLELQNLTAAEKEKIYDDMALKLHELLIDVKYQGFELIETEVFHDENGQPLPAEPKPRSQITAFLNEQADREAYAHAYVQNFNSQFTAESEQSEVGSISFTRLGDFYECYGDEAKIFSEVYGATLTSRQGVDMCGIPAHTLEKATEKLKEAGYDVNVNEKADINLSPEHITAMLKYDSNLHMNVRKEEILSYFLEHEEPKDRAEFIKAVYVHTSRAVMVDGNKYEYRKTADNLELSYNDEKSAIPWETVQAHVADLIKKHEYLDENPIFINEAVENTAFFVPETPKSEQLSLFDEAIPEVTVIKEKPIIEPETPTVSEVEDVPASAVTEETPAVADIDEVEYSFKIGDIIELDTGIYEISAVKADLIDITDTTTDDIISVTEEELYENGFTVLEEAKAEISRDVSEVETVTHTAEVEAIIPTAEIFTPAAETVTAPEYDIDPHSLVGKYYTIGEREFVVDEVNTEWNTVSFMDISAFRAGYPLFRTESIGFLIDIEKLDRERETEVTEPDITELAIDGVFVPPETTEPEKPKAQNYKITDDNLGVGGAKTKYQNNIEAIKALQKIELDRHRRLREATPEEQEILSKYVGWGGISQAFDENNSAWSSEYKELKELLSDFEYESAKKSTLNAHYTSPTVIKAIYEGLENLGFQSGNVLEPSIGVGNFFGMLPESMNSSKLYGVELDDVSGRIAQFLYPNAKIKADTGYEDVDFPDNFFDVAVGNVPFGGHSVADKRYDKLNLKIHDYFFAKSLDKVRPGGVVAFVTSKGTLDKQDSRFRKYLAERADLLGAVRLPNTAFKANAGTEVTSDIIFLQKRESVAVDEPDWVKVGKTNDGLPLNKYFLDNPDMVLGTIVEGNKLYGDKSSLDTSCIPIEGAVLSEQLKTAIKNIKGNIPDYVHDTDTELKDSILATDDVKNYSYTLVDGNLYYRENSRMNRVEFPKKTEERIKAMVELRKCVRTLINMQMDEVSDSDIVGQQFKLNTLYDNFNKKFGLINSSANRNAFKDDNGYYLLSSLEVLNEQGELERKADMFTKRTIKQRKVIASVDTASEALAVSIGETARVDLDFMAQLSGMSKERIIEDLQGVIYQVPFSDKYVTADEFLSGNIREKLAQALQYQNSIENPAEYADSVEALMAAMPKPLEASEISVKLGATWIEPETIKMFIKETLQTTSDFNVHYSRFTADWNIEGKHNDPRNALANSTFGTGRKNAYSIIEDTLNQRDSRVYDRVTENGKEKSVLNQTETMLAQEKQEILKQAFKDWIFKDPERRQHYVEKYNELFNSTRPREYDGSHITFAGMNPEITMKPHQRNAVARALYGGNTLLAHCVGAGKTFEMVAIAMESKRLGLCDKSLFVVPNHITEQIGSDFQTLYPSANILVATKKDFETKNRRRLCAKIATGDYDAVIIGHSQLEKIPISQERQEKFIRNQINEIIDGIEELGNSKGQHYAVKQLEKTKMNLEVKLERLSESPVRDNVVIFEELGVDRLFVDESHEFKNLYLYTKMRNVAGISQTEAQKSTDLYLKSQYMDEITGSKGNIHATGTPISNSMTELYTNMRYLQTDMLRKNGLEHFDSWAANFGETVNSLELAPEGGGYRARTRFAKFYNLPELMNLFKECADIKTKDCLDLPVPEATFHNVVVQPTEYQKEMVADLSERAKRVQKKLVTPDEDNMLCITNDGRKIGLDQRMMNPLLPDEPGTKVNVCVDNVHRIWTDTAADKSTQLIFCDFSTPKKDGSFNLYDDIRDKLVARGVPKEEIAFIHEHNTEEKKKALFAKVRKGDVRVLLGSTPKMGSGTNVQDKLIALHDLDAPWRPSDLEQRSGRIIRQGNKNKEVDIFRYVTEGTFDAYLYQTLENKQRYISQIMTSKSPMRSCEDMDETTLNYAEIKALCAGNPLIKEKIDIEVSFSKLKTLKSHHRTEQYRLEDNVLKHFPEAIRKTENRIKGYESDTEHLKTIVTPAESKMSVMTIMGTDYTDKEAAGKALIEACRNCKAKETLDIGEYKGFDMAVTFDKYNNVFTLELKRDMTYTTNLGADPIGNITRINNALEAIPQYLENSVTQKETLTSELAIAKGEMGKPFPREAELTEKTARLVQLNALLNLDGKQEVKQDIAAKTPPSKTSIYAKMEEFKQRKAEQGEPDKPFGLNRNNKKIDNEL